jgi:DNA-directed RNA polymerase specialized sigma24 family protein
MRHHVMATYSRPLRAYISADGFGDVGERDEVLSSFLSGPLLVPDFFPRWKSSGMPLRRWLMNAMALHCRGLRRDGARERARWSGSDSPVLEQMRASAVDAFEREWALEQIDRAFATLQRELVDGGRGLEEVVIRQHFIEHRTFEQVALELDLTRQTCASVSRRGMLRLREILLTQLREEGVPEAELAAELGRLRIALGSQG